MLFLNDSASDMKDTFHMFGPGDNFVEWNNTGVYQEFACTKGKVNIPIGKQAIISSANWQIFSITEDILLAIYSQKGLGLMAIFRSNSAKNVLEKIIKNNSDEKQLNHCFYHPNGNKIEYDLESPKDQWVITRVNDNNMDRDFSKWVFFESPSF
jgi:hypothetical protein